MATALIYDLMIVTRNVNDFALTTAIFVNLGKLCSLLFSWRLDSQQSWRNKR